MEQKPFDLFKELSKEEVDEVKSKSKYVEIEKNTILFFMKVTFVKKFFLSFRRKYQIINKC